jgi:hypothetical protein
MVVSCTPKVSAIWGAVWPSSARRVIRAICSALSFGGRPNLTPRDIAALRPAPVRSRMRKDLEQHGPVSQEIRCCGSERVRLGAVQETTADAFGLPVFHRGASPAVPRDAIGTSKHFLKGFQKFGTLRRGALGRRSRPRPWWLPPCWKVGEHNMAQMTRCPLPGHPSCGRR